MKANRSIIFIMLLAIVMAAGCGQTHRQQWYQASVAYTGTVNTTTVLVERGILDKEDVQPLVPMIEQANKALKEMAGVADWCDKYPDACNEAAWDYLMAQVSAVLFQLDTMALEKMD